MKPMYRLTICEIEISEDTSYWRLNPSLIPLVSQDFEELDIAAVVLAANKGQKVRAEP